MTLWVGSLFAGIGGFDLGLERAGMRTLWFCESDPYCQRVLAKHWPTVPCYGDVRTIGRIGLPIDYPDVLCGGFPCQDISSAGMKAGVERGEVSGLWREMFRLVCELRPRYVIVENVSDILARGLDIVLGDLATIRYDAEWGSIRARDIGAPIGGRGRDRTWIVAYPDGGGREGPRIPRQTDGELVASTARGSGPVLGVPGSASDHWATEPDVGRVAYGVPARVERLHALGNSLVPQIAEWIGRRIVEYEGGL